MTHGPGLYPHPDAPGESAAGERGVQHHGDERGRRGPDDAVLRDEEDVQHDVRGDRDRCYPKRVFRPIEGVQAHRLEIHEDTRHLNKQEYRESPRPGGKRCPVEEVEEAFAEDPASCNDRDREQERVGEGAGERRLYQ